MIGIFDDVLLNAAGGAELQAMVAVGDHTSTATGAAHRTPGTRPSPSQLATASLGDQHLGLTLTDQTHVIS